MNRDWIARVVAVVFAAALVSIVGIVISALNAPSPAVFDDWGRIDDIARRVASWEYVLIALVCVLAIVLVPEVGRARVVLGLAAGYVVVLAAASVLGVLAVLERQTLQLDGTRPTIAYYAADERLGEIVVLAGRLLAIVAIGAVVAAGWRRPRADTD